MAISFQSDEEVLRKLRDKLRKMSDEELIEFGKKVRKLAENPFQKQLEMARKSGSEGARSNRILILSVIRNLRLILAWERQLIG